MSTKQHNMEVRSDADLQAIQTSVAFRNISDAVEQYRRQFGLAFLALIAFSAVHVGLVVIANLYTMQTRVNNGLLTATTDSPAPVGVATTTESVDLSYIMTNMDEKSQIKALSDMKSASFVDAQGNYRQYTVTGFQLGGWKRSEVKLYTSVGHILEYVRGKGVRVYSETGATAGEANYTKRNLLQAPTKDAKGSRTDSPTEPPESPTDSPTASPTSAPTVSPTTAYPTGAPTGPTPAPTSPTAYPTTTAWGEGVEAYEAAALEWQAWWNTTWRNYTWAPTAPTTGAPTMDWTMYSAWLVNQSQTILQNEDVANAAGDSFYTMDAVTGAITTHGVGQLSYTDMVSATIDSTSETWMKSDYANADKAAFIEDIITKIGNYTTEVGANYQGLLDSMYAGASENGQWNSTFISNATWFNAAWEPIESQGFDLWTNASWLMYEKQTNTYWKDYAAYLTHLSKSPEAQSAFQESYDAGFTWAPTANWTWAPTATYIAEDGYAQLLHGWEGYDEAAKLGLEHYNLYYNNTNMDTWQTELEEAGGDANVAAYNIMSDVITEITSQVSILTEGFSMYKASGWIGDTTTVAATDHSTPTSGTYGCTGKTVAQIKEFNSDCESQAMEKCETNERMIGGFFFSEILGTFEAFLAHVPDSYCTAVVEAMYEKKRHLLVAEDLTGMDVQSLDFVYMLHGWGENADFLLHMSPFIDTLHHECLESGAYTAYDGTGAAERSLYAFDCISSYGFVLVCPEDGSTPYGGKTWYRNNVFTGFHMDMIMFELPAYIEDSMRLSALSKSLFGFSMGAFGTVSMLLTYSSHINAAAAFNGPMDANPCFYAGTCHLECGVDAILCELLWVTVNVAFNPYVLVEQNKPVESVGYYEPVAFGVAAAIFSPGQSPNQAKCYASSTDDNFKVVIWTGTSGRFFNYDDENVEVGIAGNYYFDRASASCGSQTSQKAWDCVVIKTLHANWQNTAGENTDQYFWLNPIYFTIATSNFAPSHNPVTGAAVDGSPYYVFGTTSYWHSFFNALPLMRLTKHNDALGSTTNVIYLFMGCDSNDPFGLAAIMTEFATEVQDTHTALTINGAYVYESSESHGHNFSEADCKLALQWFTEALVAGVTETSPTASPTASEMEPSPSPGRRHLLAVTWNTAARQSCWIRPDEAGIQIKGGILSYAGDVVTGVSDCADYVGSWYPEESEVEIVTSVISWILAAKAEDQKEYFDSKAGDTEYEATVLASKNKKTAYLAES